MNIDEMLIYADINQINKIADNYLCQCDRHSKTDIIQTIIYTILKDDTVKTHINNLDGTEFAFIQLLYLDSRNKYTIEDLIAKGKQATELNQSSIKPRELVIKALKNGWIFQGVGKKHLLIYLVPEDFKKIILNAVKSRVIKKINTIPDIDYYRDERSLLISDLITFIRYVGKEDILLTSEGNIYKRQQSSLLQSLLVKEESLKKVAFRFGYGRRYNEYPDRFSLLYDYAFFNKYIFEDENGFLSLTPQGRKWLTKIDYYNDEREIYRFWIRLYKNPIPYLQVIVRFIDLVGFNNWVQIESLKKVILFWIKDFYYEKKEDMFKDRILKMMLHLGIIQIGNKDGDTFIRITEDGHKWISGFTNFDVKKIIMK